jgi:hypothetical protein
MIGEQARSNDEGERLGQAAGMERREHQAFPLVCLSTSGECAMMTEVGMMGSA